METEVAKKLFTVDEYLRMGEAGIFDPEARLELIEGEIIEMSPVGDRHVICVNRATALFSARLAGKAMVSVQNPVRLSRYTEPQPDILLAPWRDDFYASKRLSAEHALLVIEISDTTIRYDRNRKMPLYAKAGVRELWIENLQDDVILVYRNPGAETFATSLTFKRARVSFPYSFSGDRFYCRRITWITAASRRIAPQKRRRVDASKSRTW